MDTPFFPRADVVPLMLFTGLFVSLEILLGTVFKPVFGITLSLLLLAWLTGLLVAAGWLLVMGIERRLADWSGSPLLLGGLVLLGQVVWYLGWNHPGTYLPLVAPFFLALLREPVSPPEGHREFRWLTVVGVSLAGTASWKVFHVWRYGTPGLPWREVLFIAAGYLFLRWGPRAYGWLRKRLLGWRRSGILLILAVSLGASLYWFLEKPRGHFEPYFDGRVPSPASSPRKASVRPNIIIISLDTLRWDRAAKTDAVPPSTPAMESLRRDSVQFPSLFSTSSWTLPAYASLFSGRLPERHGAVVEANSRIYASVPHYTQYLRRMGYATAGFTDGVLVRKELGFSRGFDRYWEQPLPYRGYLPGIVEKTHALFPEWAPDFHHHPEVRSFATKADVPSLRYFSTNVDRAKQWIRRDAGQPFFLFLHTYQVHDWNRFYPESVRKLRESHPRLARMLLDPGTPSRKGTNAGWHARALLYDYGVGTTDRAIGDFLSFLKQQGLYRDSLIVFVSDHGEGFNQESTARFHGRGQLNEVLIRVPLWMKLPGNRLKGKTYPGLLQITDVFPMVLEAMGEEPPFVPAGYPSGILGGPGWEDGTGRARVRGSIKSTRGPNPRFFVRSGDYKLTRDLGRQTREFYRVERRRPRQRPVLSSSVPPEERKRLETAMEKLVRRHRDGPDPYRHQNVRIEKRMREELRGMGYLK